MNHVHGIARLGGNEKDAAGLIKGQAHGAAGVQGQDLAVVLALGKAVALYRVVPVVGNVEPV